MGNDGPTHHGVFDISFMLSIPGFTVSAPKDGNELLSILNLGLKNKLMLSIRYPKSNTHFDSSRDIKEIDLGTWEVLKNGSNICILTFGSMIDSALEVCKYYKRNNDLSMTLINCRFIKPIDEKLMKKLVKSHDFFITIEEGILSGGFGDLILKYFNKNDLDKKIVCMGINDSFTTHGDRESLLKLSNLDVNSIIENIKKFI